MNRRILVFLGAVMSLVAATASSARSSEARIYAAASLTDVIEAVTAQFEPSRNSRVVASYGASNMLAEQLHEGAAPGVFVSASVEWVDKLDGWGLVETGTRVNLASNTLVVIVPTGALDPPKTIEELADVKYARIALADPAAVPAGKYAKAALDKAGVFAALRKRVVAAQDVRTALTYVERREAAVGIVYATDAAASAKVDVAFVVPSHLYPKIVYSMVLVKGANRSSRELYELLKTAKAQDAFEKAGFAKP